VAHYRHELEEAKRENELLKRRIRELERQIKGEADGQRGRRGAPVVNGDGATNGAANEAAGEGTTS
jgi:cell division septum initiation protein DivIVA